MCISPKVELLLQNAQQDTPTSGKNSVFLSCFVWPGNNGLVKKLSQNADFDLFLKLLYLGGDSNVKTMKETHLKIL